MGFLVLFTSGGAQMTFHSCAVDGSHFFLEHCNQTKRTEALNTATSECCKTSKQKNSTSYPCDCAVNKNAVKNDCCSENYFFSLSPYPSVFTKFTVAIPCSQPFYDHSKQLRECGNFAANPFDCLRHEKPPSKFCEHYLSDMKCVWLI